jgi:radical SAM family uncharacterized protein/radical SAM-linked protein
VGSCFYEGYIKMTHMKDKILSILPLVSKPSRYIGAEVNSCVKDPSSVSLLVALCFPDVYEVGISHLGLKILYEIFNARDDIYAERCFAPWPDMEEKLKEHKLPLTTLETFTPLSGMDLIGFTLQYELSYTNVLNMLSLAGLPLLSKDRSAGHPLVIAGGPCALNPEPLADFIDAFVIGDAEEAVLEIADIIKTFKSNGGVSKGGVTDAHREVSPQPSPDPLGHPPLQVGRENGSGHYEGDGGNFVGRDAPGASKEDVLKALSKIEGVYVPSHFEMTKGEDGKIRGIRNVAGGPDRVRRRVVADLDAVAYPTRPVVPYMAAVHNRVTLEVARGCPRGCRFCQAGYIYRPMRERSLERLTCLAEDSLSSTGYEELSLSSLSTGDFSALLPLMKSLMDSYEKRRVSISLPSLRVGTLTPEMCAQIKRVRKTGFTIAPEAGTQRLRDVINKNVTEEALIQTASTVFSEGWGLIKLYFMVGLPTEDGEDIEGIVRLSRRVLDAGRKAGRRAMVNVGVSAFVPKPHTPFQWMGQIPVSEIRAKKDHLKKTLGKKPFALKTGFAEMSALEAALARGGRELGAAVFHAWQAGARFDGWTEMFDYARWTDAFQSAGLDLETEAGKGFGLDEVLPWDHIDTGVTKAFLKKELKAALKVETTPDCRARCTACGLKCTLVEGGQSIKQNQKAAYKGDTAGDKEAHTALKETLRADASPLKAHLPSARVRIRYSKLMPLAHLSHSELMNLFFRAIARAGLPVAFSEGFNPHPKVSFGPALAVGIESEAEILDIELSYAIDLIKAVKNLNSALPGGIRVGEARVLGPGEPAAGADITRFTYECRLPQDAVGHDPEAVRGLVEDWLGREQAVVRRISDKGDKDIDIRPMVDSLVVEDVSGAVNIGFTLKESGGKSAKPFELIQSLFGMPPQQARAVRLKRLKME